MFGLACRYFEKVLVVHPDKGGSADGFQQVTAVRDFLRSPMRFFAHRVLHGTPPARMLPLGAADDASLSVVRSLSRVIHTRAFALAFALSRRCCGRGCSTRAAPRSRC